VARQVVVAIDPADLVIRRGPFMSASPALADLGADEQAMSETDALASGHTYPTALELNRQALRDKAVLALDVNAAYLALGTPTAAQVATQVARLTRECSGLIRLALDLTRTTDGT
jgi:hypothetical protein